MSTIKYLFAIVFLAISFAACDIEHLNECDDEAPYPPENIEAYQGDNKVELEWQASGDRDIAGYNVYWSYSYDGKYTLIGSTKRNYFTDYEANNGTTYYYAVTAYDFNGNESELSRDVVYSTPRPEGYNQTIFDYRKFPNTAGYDFSGYKVVKYEDADVFFENYEGEFYLNVFNDSDIQDMGRTTDILDILKAPGSGWSPTKDAKAIVGHTYVIWTWDNHYAKLRISNITNERVTFDWTYQTAEGNKLIKRSVAKGGVRQQPAQDELNRKH